MDYELSRHGVKGMKWGVRKKYRNSDGSLNDRGVKKYAKKAYARESFRSNKTVAGKALDAYTGAHKTKASIRYDLSSKQKNKEAAEKFLADKQKNRSKNAARNKERAIKTVAKGAEIASKAALYSAVDDVFYGGAGKKIAKETIIQTGRAAVTAYTMARGGYDIHWYDN